MIGKSKKDKSENYDVKACAPGDLSPEELEACVTIIRRGAAVNQHSAEAELPQAELLAVARSGDDIVGVGVIKRIRRVYASSIADRSGASFDQDTPELGYVAVDYEHRRHGLSHRIVAELLSKHDGRLFATTSDDYMKKILTKAGFKQKGREWEGQSGQLSLWDKD
jgi:predicted GNAT family N-acyltransferase